MSDKIINFSSQKKYSIYSVEEIIKNIFDEYKRQSKGITEYSKRLKIKKDLNWKVLKDEIIPILKVAKYFNADLISFTLSENLSYDGIIFIGEQQHYIECVSAIDYKMKDIKYKILDSNENHSVCIPANYNSEDLKKSVGYTTKHKPILKQKESEFEAGYINFNKNLIIGYNRILKKVKKSFKKDCYKEHILILTIEPPFLPIECNIQLIKSIWNNRIKNNPFSNLFIYETNCNFDDFRLITKI